MSSRIDLAKQLLRDGEYVIAKQMLGKEGSDPQALYLLSLLYRYDDEYGCVAQIRFWIISPIILRWLSSFFGFELVAY